MDKAQVVFNKLAFIAVTPFKVKDEKELKSGKGFTKETGNQMASGFTGALAGGVVGAVLGAAAGAGGGGGTEGALAGAGIGASLLGGVGGVVSSIRGVRKTEREAGVQPMGVNKFLGRTLGRVVSAPVPVVGSLAGDFVVSRHLQDYEPLKRK